MGQEDRDDDRLAMFTQRYLANDMPWDSGIAPPELVEAITGQDHLPAGRALDIGCGTGTNSIYLAKHGWQVLGIDFALPAVERAQAKATREADAIEGAGGSVAFRQADITTLDPPATPYTLLFDLGCLNGISPTFWPGYVKTIAASSTLGTVFMLYAHFPSEHRSYGCTPDDIDRLFTPLFTLELKVISTDIHGGSSGWYWLRRH